MKRFDKFSDFIIENIGWFFLVLVLIAVIAAVILPIAIYVARLLWSYALAPTLTVL